MVIATATYPPPPPFYILYNHTTDDVLPSLEEQGVRQLYPKGPNVGRATLIPILELQIQRYQQAVEDVKRRREDAWRLLKESLGTLDGQ